MLAETTALNDDGGPAEWVTALVPEKRVAL
jgi:hypothetical protein